MPNRHLQGNSTIVTYPFLIYFITGDEDEDERVSRVNIGTQTVVTR